MFPKTPIKLATIIGSCFLFTAPLACHSQPCPSTEIEIPQSPTSPTFARRVQVSRFNKRDDSAPRIAPYMASGNGVIYRSGRALAETEDSDYAEEWIEDCVLFGMGRCQIVYLFAKEDLQNEDGTPKDIEYYPFDSSHIKRILLVEKDTSKN